jgi:hypothetical protein
MKNMSKQNMSKQPMTLEELFNKLATDFSKTVEAVQINYNKILEEVKQDERFVGLDDKGLEQIARNRLVSRERRESSSPAVTWEGQILAAGNLIDGVAKQRKFSVLAFKKDPVSAQQEKGIMYENKLVRTDENGVPLYPKTESNDKWKRTGTKVPDHSWMRSIYGIAQPIDKKTGKAAGQPQWFSMTLNDLHAVDTKSLLEGKFNKPLRFKGIDKTTDEHKRASEYLIGDSAYTLFEIATDLKMPSTEILIQNVVPKKIEILGNLDEYHEQNKDNFGRIVIVEGTVSYLATQPNKNGSLFMSLDDETMMDKVGDDGKAKLVGCYVPTDRGIEMDFAADSRVHAIGQSSQGNKWDPIAKVSLDEPGDVMLNVYGIYCPEMFKVVKAPNLPPKALQAEPEPSTPSPTEGEEW